MRKYKYIIHYKYIGYKSNTIQQYEESYCTDNFFKFLFNFVRLKRVYDTIIVEWNKPVN